MTKIFTSHVGSLPRSQRVVDFIFARENEVEYDLIEFDSSKNISLNNFNLRLFFFLFKDFFF